MALCLCTFEKYSKHAEKSLKKLSFSGILYLLLLALSKHKAKDIKSKMI